MNEVIIEFDPPRSGGGGGGSYTAGNGIDIAGGVITNTGTLIQPDETGTNSGVGILLKAGAPGPGGSIAGGIQVYGPNISGVGTYPPGLIGSNFDFYTGDVACTDTAAGSAVPGRMSFTVGKASVGVKISTGGQMQFTAPLVYETYINGGGLSFLGGYGSGGTLGNGGNLSFAGGPGNAQGGNVSFAPGAGAANGVVLFADPIPSTDPHILGAIFQYSVANAGYVLIRSQG